MFVPLFRRWSNCQDHKTQNSNSPVGSCSQNQNVYFTLQVKSKVSPQDSCQHFQHWKQKSHRDVSFYNMTVPPCTYSVLVHLGSCPLNPVGVSV